MVWKYKKLNPFKSIRAQNIKRRLWIKVNLLKRQTLQIYSPKQEQVIPYVNKPGIAFSFDDSFRIQDWYKYGLNLFGFYDVKATFNINAIHHFESKREHTQREIDMLIELQSNGHEIAHHSLNHKGVFKSFGKKDLMQYIEEEIVSLFDWINNQTHSQTNERFKKPVSFAFPYFHYTKDAVEELVPKYFKIVRGNNKNESLTSFNHTGFAPSICIDRNMLFDIKYIKKLMNYTKKLGYNIIFTCHSILPDDINWNDFGWGKESIESGNWRISPTLIQEIINEARKLDLEFYTTAEIAGVATFADRNFEQYVRGMLKNSSDKWIKIEDLTQIKSLDLSNRNISNLDGIQYFLNLETLNLANNHISDFRLLNKLSKLKEIKGVNISNVNLSKKVLV